MKKRVLIIFLTTVLLSCILLLWGINPDIFMFAINKRIVKIGGILVTGASLGISTLVFQTITGNRILSPSILGLDSLYIMLNVILVFSLGSFTKLITDTYINFVISTILMTFFSTTLYLRIFMKIKSLYKVILIGVVMGSLFSSVIGMLQTIMNPDSFSVIIDKLFASFNIINKDLLIISSVILLILNIILLSKSHLLDALSLGVDKSINLGINYYKEVKWILMIIFIMISISTALVGPVSFLGFFAANICRNMLPTFKHHFLIPGSAFIAISTLLIGQILVERVFSFSLPIGVLISLCGGIYFILLLLKGSNNV